jgi:hypothetical protein
LAGKTKKLECGSCGFLSILFHVGWPIVFLNGSRHKEKSCLQEWARNAKNRLFALKAASAHGHRNITSLFLYEMRILKNFASGVFVLSKSRKSYLAGLIFWLIGDPFANLFQAKAFSLIMWYRALAPNPKMRHGK